MNQSHIEVSNRGVTAYVGPDAVNLMRAITLKSSLDLWRKTKIIPTRGVTITKMLLIAKEYTGKKYTPRQVEQAIEDLRVWIETMKTALPVERR